MTDEVILSAIREMHAEGKRYFLARDIAERVDQSAYEIGQVLPRLEDQGHVSKWTTGDTPYRWQTTLDAE